MYPDKFIRNNVVATSVLLSVVIVTLPSIQIACTALWVAIQLAATNLSLHPILTSTSQTWCD